jgi:hypothetical protein
VHCIARHQFEIEDLENIVVCNISMLRLEFLVADANIFAGVILKPDEVLDAGDIRGKIIDVIKRDTGPMCLIITGRAIPVCGAVNPVALAVKVFEARFEKDVDRREDKDGKTRRETQQVQYGVRPVLVKGAGNDLQVITGHQT